MWQEIIQNRIFVIAVAVILDLIIGDPHFLWHPVQGIGALISGVEKMLRKQLKIKDDAEADVVKKRVAGFFLSIVVITLSVLVPALLLYLVSHYWNKGVAIGIECVMCYQILAMKSLRVESMKVYKTLVGNGKTKSEKIETEDRLSAARTAVSMIVGRDTENLDEKGIVKAAVETVAENTSDGVIAPLFYMFLFGPVGGFFYKAVNTMDSMVGYKNDKYKYLGTFAAKLDDVVNFIPARLSAILMILAAGILGQDMVGAWKIFIRDRKNHASPNSAQTEAVCAGALGVQLAGNAYYFGKLYEKPIIGDAKRDIEVKDIKRANWLMYGTGILMTIVGISILMLVLQFVG